MNCLPIEIDEVDIAPAAHRREQSQARKGAVVIYRAQTSTSALKLVLFHDRHKSFPPSFVDPITLCFCELNVCWFAKRKTPTVSLDDLGKFCLPIAVSDIVFPSKTSSNDSTITGACRRAPARQRHSRSWLPWCRTRLRQLARLAGPSQAPRERGHRLAGSRCASRSAR